MCSSLRLDRALLLTYFWLEECFIRRSVQLWHRCPGHLLSAPLRGRLRPQKALSLLHPLHLHPHLHLLPLPPLLLAQPLLEEWERDIARTRTAAMLGTIGSGTKQEGTVYHQPHHLWLSHCSLHLLRLLYIVCPHHPVFTTMTRERAWTRRYMTPFNQQRERVYQA